MFRSVLVGFILISTMVSGVASTTLAEQPPPPAQSPWSVVDQLEIEVDGTPSSLSPDGRWIAGQGDDGGFCIWSVPDLEDYCDGTGIDVAEEMIAWAPDSSAVAFSADSARTLVDGDIQVFDVATKTLTNLTDDPDEIQQPDIGSDEPGVTHTDVFPAWSADSQQILFIRGDFGPGRFTTEIMSLEVNTAELDSVFTISPTNWLVTYSPLFLEPGGSILVSVMHPEPDNGQNGIWRIAANGSRIDQVVKPTDDNGGYGTKVIDVSADGSTALLLSQPTLNLQIPDVSPYLVLDLETGEVVPLSDNSLDVAWESVFGFPRFVGDTSEVVYAVVVVNEAGSTSGSETDLDLSLVVGLTDPQVVTDSVGDRRNRFGVQWSSNGIVLITDSGNSALLLTVDASPDASTATPAPPCSCAPIKGN